MKAILEHNKYSSDATSLFKEKLSFPTPDCEWGNLFAEWASLPSVGSKGVAELFFFVGILSL